MFLWLCYQCHRCRKTYTETRGKYYTLHLRHFIVLMSLISPFVEILGVMRPALCLESTVDGDIVESPGRRGRYFYNISHHKKHEQIDQQHSNCHTYDGYMHVNASTVSKVKRERVRKQNRRWQSWGQFRSRNQASPTTFGKEANPGSSACYCHRWTTRELPLRTRLTLLTQTATW